MGAGVGGRGVEGRGGGGDGRWTVYLQHGLAHVGRLRHQRVVLASVRHLQPVKPKTGRNNTLARS